MKKVIILITLATLSTLLGFNCKINSDPTDEPVDSTANPVSREYQAVVAFPNLTFSSPVEFTHAGDGTNKVYVIEQRGVIRVFDNVSTTSQAAVFLDIDARVDAGGEMGLLGLAFHPDFKTNGYFYVNYNRNSPSRQTVISRFRVNPGSQVADANSEKILLTFEQPYSNHNGGKLAFGADSYLYIATGDGGSGGDPQNNAQNRKNLLGKILRIDVNVAETEKYTIPDNNPYRGNTEGFMQEIYAYGLRNPWRFSFDSANNNLWAGDVGQNEVEEIDIITKGGNYGWKIKEANDCYGGGTNCNQAGLIAPVWSYKQGADGRSVTGGVVYRGKKLPDLVGKYVFGDYVSGKIWSLKYDGAKATDSGDIIGNVSSVSAFGEDADKELYILNYSTGKVYKLEKKGE
ncbi:sorbosone dehydrogenase family protein [Emticicia sp. BO119]|uniref:PQQ-dependent sugar dehydrogenase n=1 Tax=Emticicia sp. BO119 TaxID=2757768 RepID=UPI0015F017C5|nr:PQQ-dependent sugar dehydrogenase [Emticicia sp. BO119]MBA4851294.1 PQQ-dependent sugar dehydrogenase [Emticicia sp. BO119]